MNRILNYGVHARRDKIVSYAGELLQNSSKLLTKEMFDLIINSL